MAKSKQDAKLQVLQSTKDKLQGFEASQAGHMADNDRLKAQVEFANAQLQHYEGMLRHKDCQLEELHQHIRMLESNNFGGHSGQGGNYGGNFGGQEDQGGNYNGPDGQDGYGRGGGRNRGRGRKGRGEGNKTKDSDMQQ